MRSQVVNGGSKPINFWTPRRVSGEKKGILSHEWPKEQPSQTTNEARGNALSRIKFPRVERRKQRIHATIGYRRGTGAYISPHKKRRIRQATPVGLKKENELQINEVLEEQLLHYFLETTEKTKKIRIPKKQLLAWQKQIEPVTYLWTMIQFNHANDYSIRGQLSCQQLVEDFPLVLLDLEELLATRSRRKSCSIQWVNKLKGYVVFITYLEELLERVQKNKGQLDHACV